MMHCPVPCRTAHSERVPLLPFHFHFNLTPFHLVKYPRASSCILLASSRLRFASSRHRSPLLTSPRLHAPPRPPIIPSIHLRSSFRSPSAVPKRNCGNGAWHCSWRTSAVGWSCNAPLSSPRPSFSSFLMSCVAAHAFPGIVCARGDRRHRGALSHILRCRQALKAPCHGSSPVCNPTAVCAARSNGKWSFLDGPIPAATLRGTSPLEKSWA